MTYQNVFKRYELKYMITKDQKRSLYKAMNEYMEPDQFGKSTIRNIYYDTPDKLLIRKSLEKPKYKEKLRVRSYGLAKPDSKVFVEIKKKYDGIVYKRRMELEEKIATNYLVKHIPLEEKTQISREIDYLMSTYGRVEPSIFLSYNREAYASKEDPNFRMTFDENIVTRDYDLDLTSGIYGENDLLEGQVILEVKTAMGIPKWLLDFFSKNKIYKTSFSKYGNAYEKFILPQIFKNNSLDRKDPRDIIYIGGLKDAV
nr:polyphosphate polymerase domain-containing protein [Tissierella sp.]